MTFDQSRTMKPATGANAVGLSNAYKDHSSATSHRSPGLPAGASLHAAVLVAFKGPAVAFDGDQAWRHGRHLCLGGFARNQSSPVYAILEGASGLHLVGGWRGRLSSWLVCCHVVNGLHNDLDPRGRQRHIERALDGVSDHTHNAGEVLIAVSISRH